MPPARSKFKTGNGLDVAKITAAFERSSDRFSFLLNESALGFAIILIVCFSLFTTYLSADPDLFARLAVGRLVFDTGSVPTVDPFAFTSKKELWIDHEWLSGLVFYFVAGSYPDRLLFGFKTIFAFITIAVFLRAQCVLLGRRQPEFFWSLITTVPCVYIWLSTVRSQVFTYLFLAILFCGLIIYEKHRFRLLLSSFPLLMIFWANAHGGFVVGLGLLGLFACSNLYKRLRYGRGEWVLPLGVLFLSSFAVLLNPYPGLSYLSYIFDAVTMPRPNIDEWASLSPFSMEALWLNLVVVLIGLGAIANRRLLTLNSVLFFAVTLFFAYRHNRLQALFFITAAVYGAPFYLALKDRIILQRPRLTKIVGRAFTVFILLVTVGLLPRIARFVEHYPKFFFDMSSFPVKESDFLLESIGKMSVDLGRPLRLLTDFNSGSYLLWRLYPAFQVSLDGRYEELYPDKTIYLVDRAFNSTIEERTKAIEELQPDYILSPLQNGRAGQSELIVGWKELYVGNNFKILAKKISESKN